MNTTYLQSDRPGSPRRQLILDFIEAYLLQHGYAPSLVEIREASGLKSPNTVEYHIRRLIRDGELISEPYKTRTLIPARLAGQNA